MEKKLKTLIIDSEPLALDKLRSFAANADELEIVKECKDTVAALENMTGDFQRTLSRLREAYNRMTPPADTKAPDCHTDYIFIRNGKEYDKVLLADIVYIAGDAEYLAFHVAGRDKPLREKSSFATIRRMLTPDFVQVHRSSVINLHHLCSVGRTYVVMDNGTRLKVSNGNREHFYSHIAALTVGKS